jgi:hypothetical protein
VKYSYKIYPEVRLVVYRVDGNPKREVVKQMYTAIVSDPEYDSNYKGIADWSHVTSHLSREDVSNIAELVLADRKLRQLWVALVSKPMSTALATVYSQKVIELHPVEICSKPERASKVIGFDVADYLL